MGFFKGSDLKVLDFQSRLWRGSKVTGPANVTT